MIWPEPIEVSSSPSISGSVCRPASVGDEPSTSCRYSERYVIEPNRAKPTIRPIPLATEKVRLRNRLGGSTASLARRSTARNTTRSTIAAANRPITSAEPHGYVVPPQVQASTTEASAPASAAAPK